MNQIKPRRSRFGCDEINQIFSWMNEIPSNLQKNISVSLSLSFAWRLVPVITWILLSFLQYNFGRRFKVSNQMCVNQTKKKTQLHCLLWFLIVGLFADNNEIHSRSYFLSDIFCFCFSFIPKIISWPVTGGQWLVFNFAI